MTGPVDGSRPELSVVVPCFDEEQRLARSLPALEAFFDARGRSHEILIVDDGSEDDTVGAAERLAGPSTRVLRYERNRGKGYAVRYGVARARGERVLFTDADLSTPLDELARLEAALEDGHDIAIGSRALDRARIEVRQGLVRDRLGRTFNLVVRALGVRGLRDTQCGFKLFTAEAAAAVFPHLVIDRWTFDVEALYVAVKMGLRVKEVPVRWVNSPDSRVSVLRDALGTIRDLVRIRLRWLGRKPG